MYPEPLPLGPVNGAIPQSLMHHQDDLGSCDSRENKSDDAKSLKIYPWMRRMHSAQRIKFKKINALQNFIFKLHQKINKDQEMTTNESERRIQDIKLWN